MKYKLYINNEFVATIDAFNESYHADDSRIFSCSGEIEANSSLLDTLQELNNNIELIKIFKEDNTQESVWASAKYSKINYASIFSDNERNIIGYTIEFLV